MPHILLTVHGTVPTTWALIGKAGIGLAGQVGGDQPQPRRGSSPRNVSTLLTARLPPTARPSRRCPGPLIWSSRSQTTAGTRRSVERGDRKKSCAESLRTTRPLYPSDFRWVTPALDRPPTESRRAPCSPRPVFIDLFWHRGLPVPSVRAQHAQLRWWEFVCTVSRVTMPHTMLRFPTVKARTGLSRSTIYLRISRGTFPAPVSLGGRAVGWIEAEVNAWLTARIAQRRLIAARGAGAPGSVCRQAQRPDRAGRGVVAEAVEARRAPSASAKVVEAAGVEPASEITWRKESTCVSGSCLVSPPDIENRQECLATRPVSFAGGPRTSATG